LADSDDDVADDGDGYHVYCTLRSWQSFFLFVIVYFSFVAINLFVIVNIFVFPPLSSRVLSLMALSFDFEDDGVIHGHEAVC